MEPDCGLDVDLAALTGLELFLDATDPLDAGLFIDSAVCSLSTASGVGGLAEVGLEPALADTGREPAFDPNLNKQI